MSKKQPTVHGAGRFAMIPSCAFNDTRLTSEEVATLGCIATYLNNKETGWWSIGQGEIAAKRGILRTSVNRIVQHLVKLGYLEQRGQTRKAGGKIESRYFMNMNTVHVPKEYCRVQLDEPENEDESGPEASRGVALEYDVAPGAHGGMSPQGDIHVAVGRHPRRPRATSNIRMTDPLTDHKTEMASPSLENGEAEADPERLASDEPTYAEAQIWARTKIGRAALDSYPAGDRWRPRIQREALMQWIEEHPVQWEICRGGLAEARPALAAQIGP